MIIHRDIEQGSDEWRALRAGKMTSSIASELVTPTGRLSQSYKARIGTIIAEIMGWQEPPPDIDTEDMAEGREKEPEARAWFEVETDLTVETVGFVESDNGLLGDSPDGMIVETGAPLELKKPKPGTHIRWLLDGGIPKDHVAQVHFHIVLFGSDHGWFMSYNENMEPLLIRQERDEYTDTMEHAIANYIDEFKTAYERITGVGWDD